MKGFIKVHDFSTADVSFLNVSYIVSISLSYDTNYVGATVIDLVGIDGQLCCCYVSESLDEVLKLIEAATT